MSSKVTARSVSYSSHNDDEHGATISKIVKNVLSSNRLIVH